MRERAGHGGSDHGFSMVEMLVAVAFVSILMAGFAGVFKSALNTFYTSGEKISSVRRNRSSIDILYNDINSIGLYIQSLQAIPSGLGKSCPPFYVLPQQLVTDSHGNTSNLKGLPTRADQLYYYQDIPYPFTCSILPGTTITNANQYVQSGAKISNYDGKFLIDCGSPIFAKQISDNFNSTTNPMPLNMMRQDRYGVFSISSVTISNSNSGYVSVVTQSDPLSSVTGSGSVAGPPIGAPITNAGVVMFIPAQMVRYSIQLLSLDPLNSANLVPCLVRDQGSYSSSGFTATPSLQQVIAEDVWDFRIFLSASPGSLSSLGTNQVWAPFNTTTPTKDQDISAWDGIIANVNTQLGFVGQSKLGGQVQIDRLADPCWFRSIPMTLRLDITTRTASARTDYNTAGSSTVASSTNGLAYRTLKRSLVMVPRHFGLPITN